MFPTEQAWIINPGKKRRARRKKGSLTMATKSRSRSRRRVRRVSVKRKTTVSRATRKRTSHPTAHRRHKRRSYAANPSRRSRRRSYRRNPIVSGGFLMDALSVTGGFVGNRVITNMVVPMIPGLSGIVSSTPIARIGVKALSAWGLGYLGKMFLSQRTGNLLMVGGFVDALDDAVKTFVAPFIPALGDMSSYPMLPMGSYATLGDYATPYGSAMGSEYSSSDDV